MGGATPGKSSLIEATYGSGGGAPLPADTRAPLESALGADLSAVRVHTGGDAALSAASLDARAYAVGQDIHFGAGAYDPSSAEGRHVLAHEVAHTVQQQGAAPSVQRKALVSTPGDAAEQQAGRFADAFVAGAPTAGLVTPGLRPDATVHCYGFGEHKDIPTKHLHELQQFLGTPEGVTWAKQHGYDAKQLLAEMATDPAAQGKTLKGKHTEFDYGDPTAMMGDLFGSWQDVYNIDTATRDGLRKDGSTAENQALTHGQYLELAQHNDNHFAGKNKIAWRKMHEEAIDTSSKAGTDEQLYQQALFIEAASGHYLTDGFSAGHQFEKGVILAAILKDLQDKPLVTEAPEMQGVIAAVGTNNIAQLILKLIHDRMNLEGFIVHNDKGMKWRTFGDGHLDASPETQRIAALAVFESRQQVIAARKGKVSPSMIDEVAKFFPSEESMQAAEDQARAYIPQARKEVVPLIYRERGDAPGEMKQRVPLVGKALGTFLESRIDVIGDPGRERQLTTNEQLDDAAGRDRGPRFDGGFTVKRF